MECVLASAVIGSGLIQGGYFPSVFLSVGILLSVTCMKTSMRKIQPAECILWAFSVLYLFSSLINGYNSASLAQSCLPGVCACFLSCYLSLSEPKKKKLFQLVLIGSGLYAVIGMLAYGGIVTFSSSVVSRRLQFPFQYANSAGIWYAASVMLCQDSEQKLPKAALLPATTALFLTRSVGAIALYICIQCVRLFLLRKNHKLWKTVLLSNTMAVLFSIVLYFASGMASILVVVALCLVGWYFEPILTRAVGMRLHWACLPIGCFGAIIMTLRSGRLHSAVGTFAERLNQIIDGSALLYRHPIFGIGAGNWEYYFPYYQSAQYTSTVLHSGVIQIGVDAGIIAVVLILIFCCLAWKNIGDLLTMKLTFLLIALHSLVDFDLLFFPVCALALMVAFYGLPCQERHTRNVKMCVAMIAPLTLFLAMLFCEQRVKALIDQANMQSWETVIAQYESERILYGRNREAKDCYLLALYDSNCDVCLLEETEQAEPAGMRALLLRAQSLRRQGDEPAACALLLSELEKQSHHVRLFREVAALLTNWQVDRKYMEEYNKIVQWANGRQTILGALQGDQVEIDSLNF